MTALVFSKGVHRKCNQEEMVYLEKNIREMVDEMEVAKNPIFMPWPTTAAEVEELKNAVAFLSGK